MGERDASDLKGLITANSFSGLPTFFRRRPGSNFEDADIVVYGLPLDLGVSNRPGARFGPRAIREASLQLSWGTVWPWGFDPFERLAVLDAGDLQYTYGDHAEFREKARAQAQAVAEAGAIPFSLGGDHSVTLESLTGVTQVTGPVALIHFDAHTDTSEGPEVQHGTMFRHASKSGILVAERSVQVGIRTAYEPGDGFLRLHAPEVVREDPAVTAERIVRQVGDLPCYLTFDIDCLDPSFAPGTGTPVPGGLSTLRALEIIRALAKRRLDQGLRIAGLDIVEVAPDYDHAQITALAAVQIAHELLCLLSCQPGEP
ncbi:MAG: agmatinase [Pseudomonadota bacterium]